MSGTFDRLRTKPILTALSRHARAIVAVLFVLQWALVGYTLALARDANDEAYAARSQAAESDNGGAAAEIRSDVEELRNDVDGLQLRITGLSAPGTDQNTGELRRLQIALFALQNDVDRLRRELNDLRLR